MRGCAWLCVRASLRHPINTEVEVRTTFSIWVNWIYAAHSRYVPELPPRLFIAFDAISFELNSLRDKTFHSIYLDHIPRYFPQFHIWIPHFIVGVCVCFLQMYLKHWGKKQLLSGNELSYPVIHLDIHCSPFIFETVFNERKIVSQIHFVDGDMYNEHNVIKTVLGTFLGWISVYLFVLNMSVSDFFSVYHFQHVAKMNSVIRLDTRAYVFVSRS